VRRLATAESSRSRSSAEVSRLSTGVEVRPERLMPHTRRGPPSSGHSNSPTRSGFMAACRPSTTRSASSRGSPPFANTAMVSESTAMLR
jgi:hypothetical protein